MHLNCNYNPLPIFVTFIQAGTDFDTMIRTLCGSGNTGDACTTAINSVSNTCGTSLFNGDTSVCSGTCAAQLNAVVSACGSSVSLISIRSYIVDILNYKILYVYLHIAITI